MNEAEGVDVYWLPHCSTCQKAVEHLHGKGVVIRSLRMIRAGKR